MELIFLLFYHQISETFSTFSAHGTVFVAQNTDLTPKTSFLFSKLVYFHQNLLNLGKRHLGEAQGEMSARIPISSRAKSEINQTRSSSDKDINRFIRTKIFYITIYLSFLFRLNFQIISAMVAWTNFEINREKTEVWRRLKIFKLKVSSKCIFYLKRIILVVVITVRHSKNRLYHRI